ncbi:TetR/AcrR family transcriptional regulator [Hoeflea sp. WL0058]|uniref:TetR/AcrR family transcriptional regulator n=1 Tax=Flavimaribacter sediminis TaxID=2865987 RepID=A0AAE2ZH55_9HYPH|nr:TetR/AcrR family transcriptional regulator [Flavimaribacter sediminis]MBW8636146.1 TetR/AcrR family transcriptional regulator [Flavimaribacter sediminis]
MKTARKKKSRGDQQRERREALISAGLRIVSRYGYVNASVSRVTAAAGLAQGTLYSYFESHQAYLEELLKVEGARFFRLINKHTVISDNFFDTERSAFLAYSRYLKRHPYFLRVLTDAESAAPTSYAQHMDRVEGRYLKALQRAADEGQLRLQNKDSFRDIGEVLGGSYGHLGLGAQARPFDGDATNGLFPEWVADTYIGFIRRGFDEPIEARMPSSVPLAENQSMTTREALLEAAARVVWNVGFGDATIKAIVEEADLAVGTFYSHFESQQEIFDELLNHVRAKMVAHVRLFVAGNTRFIDREYAGFVGFFDYLRHQPWYIRIESAAAVYATETYRRHFFDLADSYVRTMRRAQANGELLRFEERDLPALAYIMMAARHYFAARYLPPTATDRSLPGHVFDTYRSFLEQGLEAR